jgi:hypothetical protein
LTLTIALLSAEISLSGECIDPVTLYMVLKSGQLIETIQNPVSIEEIINKIKTIVKDRKPSYGYVSGYIENIVLELYTILKAITSVSR